MGGEFHSVECAGIVAGAAVPSFLEVVNSRAVLLFAFSEELLSALGRLLLSVVVFYSNFHNVFEFVGFDWGKDKHFL